MAHLLMIESWVGASGNLLPPLLKSLGHTYTFVTRKPEHYQSSLNTEKHPVLRYADNVIKTETNDIPGLIHELRSGRFDGVITVCDYYIETVREVAKAFNIPCPFPAEVKTVRNKNHMRQALDKANLANPIYRLAHRWDEVVNAANEIGYPFVLKPVDLASSAFVNLIENEQALQDAFHALESFPLNFREQERDCTYLLEAYMHGTEVSVESVSFNGETTILGITDKSITGTPYFIENGHMFPAQLSEELQETVTQFVKDALDAVGFDHGIAHTEVMITDEGPRIIEINPRTAGNYIVELIERVTNIDLLHVFVDLALGLKPNIIRKESGVTSAGIMFLVPQQGGTISEIEGTDTLASDEHVVRYKVEDCLGKTIAAPIDNACYLGHVMTEDTEGLKARIYAEEALNRIQLRFSQ
ncbi:ATP-grasp domain-containing protein [Halalkalibacter sp. APA_J-10(15)]|uniref:ATP-grasp domain-containing protein n=1 Tax=Halalkalibacter sp. APA_J-10(15) TaxID=2933805 RepID=UPI001FF19E08|nr:ATP-grasp domain-containing protein [Halalkalibacter sp. APA_J-10(15)]MCK0473714.1 ATP-grasp domain-containing protein [Halalkalibacter sp. APA_J-10(15)]